ncbi:MAG: RNA methyltransferase [Sphingomonadales bacterium]
MAGTDRTQQPADGGLAMILVKPQLGENIGAAARAMYNFGLTDMRLVQPRDGWPNPHAVGMASGAMPVLDGARVYQHAEDAAAEIQHLFATTGRHRGMVKHVVTPRRAAEMMREAAARGERCGVLFGGERSGLDNDDVALADNIICVPVNPAFASINLAQAVLLVAYEWFVAGDDTPPEEVALGATRSANREELVRLFEHLESELDAHNFFRPPERRPGMVRSLRNMILRSRLTGQDVRTLRGIIGALASRR